MKGRIWSIDLIHPDTRRHCTRINVSVVGQDSPHRVILNLSDDQVFRANKDLANASSNKNNPPDLSSFMKQIGRFSFQIDNPERNALITLNRHPLSMHQKVQAACKNPVKALNDPQLRDVAMHLLHRKS